MIKGLDLVDRIEVCRDFIGNVVCISYNNPNDILLCGFSADLDGANVYEDYCDFAETAGNDRQIFLSPNRCRDFLRRGYIWIATLTHSGIEYHKELNDDEKAYLQGWEKVILNT